MRVGGVGVAIEWHRCRGANGQRERPRHVARRLLLPIDEAAYVALQTMLAVREEATDPQTLGRIQTRIAEAVGQLIDFDGDC
jgi:hypothetical protein